MATASSYAAGCRPPPAGAPSAASIRELTDAAWHLIRRAVLTDAALPDREHRWLTGPHNAMPTPVRDPDEAYGYEEAIRPRFSPTPADVDRYLDVLSWLTWLRRQPGDGPRQVKVLVARAHRLPVWKIAERIGRSDDTVRRIEAAALLAIAINFPAEIGQLSAVG